MQLLISTSLIQRSCVFGSFQKSEKLLGPACAPKGHSVHISGETESMACLSLLLLKVIGKGQARWQLVEDTLDISFIDISQSLLLTMYVTVDPTEECCELQRALSCFTVFGLNDWASLCSPRKVFQHAALELRFRFLGAETWSEWCLAILDVSMKANCYLWLPCWVDENCRRRSKAYFSVQGVPWIDC